MRTTANRIVAAGLAATIALTSFTVLPAAAAPAATRQVQPPAAERATDFSARRRYGHAGSNAAALGAFLAIAGTIAAIAAAEHRRERWEEYDRYRYHPRPYPYHPGYRHYHPY
jgi:hypothetical protein